MKQAKIDIDGCRGSALMMAVFVLALLASMALIVVLVSQNEVRMSKARSLLANTQDSVSGIADRLGFSSVYYFSRLFKKRTGLSPTDLGARPGSGAAGVVCRNGNGGAGVSLGLVEPVGGSEVAEPTTSSV